MNRLFEEGDVPDVDVIRFPVAVGYFAEGKCIGIFGEVEYFVGRYPCALGAEIFIRIVPMGIVGRRDGMDLCFKKSSISEFRGQE